MEILMKVLIVEDDTRMGALLVQALNEDGRAPTLATNGLDALELCDRESFDVVLLDVMLPGVDGFTLCRRLRDAGNQATIMMVTAKHELENRIEGLDAGADDYLIKPFSLRELLARLRAVQRRLERPVSTMVRVGPLTLDPRSRRVIGGQCAVQLSATEFDLFSFMTRNLEVALSRGRILEAVWEFPHEGSSNVIDQYVAYLRRKLEPLSHLITIQTVRGIGYRVSCVKNEPLDIGERSDCVGRDPERLGSRSGARKSVTPGNRDDVRTSL